MKKYISLCLLCCLLAITFDSSIEASDKTERFIVLFYDDISRDQVIDDDLNIKVLKKYTHLPGLVVTGQSSAVSKLRLKKNVRLIERDDMVTTNSQSTDWGIEVTHANIAWNNNYTGKNIRIGVIDTGIDLTHEDLHVVGGQSFVDYTQSFTDDNGHGTHVAGIIGAKNNTLGTVGIAPDASIFALKALDQNRQGYISDVIEAIDWSISAGMDIVNLSLSSSIDSVSMHDIINKAYASGILIVGSAGNNSSTVMFPAAYDSVIAVGSVEQSMQKSVLSPVSDKIELTAPGSEILSTYLQNSYLSMSGTSMAAAYVSGNAALIKEKYPDYTNVQIREELQRRIQDLGAAGKDSYFGYGLIQAPFERTVTSILTDKTSYRPGEAVTIKVIVHNETMTTFVSGANVTLTITPPKGLPSTMIGKTEMSGQASFRLTLSNSVKGTYNITASTVHPQYADSQVTTAFQVSK